MIFSQMSVIMGWHAVRLWGDKLEIFKSMITSHQHYHAALWAVSHTRTRYHSSFPWVLSSSSDVHKYFKYRDREFLYKDDMSSNFVEDIKSWWDIPGMCCCHHSQITPGQWHSKDNKCSWTIEMSWSKFIVQIEIMWVSMGKWDYVLLLSIRSNLNGAEEWAYAQTRCDPQCDSNGLWQFMESRPGESRVIKSGVKLYRDQAT